MNWFKSLTNKFSDLFRPRYRAIFVDDLPDQLNRNRVYLVGDHGEPWQAAMVCPCGCSANIQLSLVPHDEPRWEASVGRRGTVSLYPSVWRTRGCYAHFFVREGKIAWARDSGRPFSHRPSQ